MPAGITNTSKRYDVFLSHHSAEKPLVEELAQRLAEAGVLYFLDSESICVGESWVAFLEEALEASNAFVPCLGSSGVGPWMEKEIHSALSRAAQDSSFRIVPVLLPGSSREQLNSVSLFLRQYHACDLRKGFEGSAFEELLQALGIGRSGSALSSGGTQAQLSAEILATLERLQSRFSASIHPFLAGDQLISRRETQEVLSLLDDDTYRIVVVHGAAGSGKSGILLELAQELAELGDVVLPIRLDRVELKGDPRRFGREILSLPDSPGKCLATVKSEQRVLLLLDQLDALRWTGAHSSAAWDVCRETILDALNALPTTKVVVCCRTFDLQHDPQLRSWKERLRNLREVQICDLSDEQVRAAVDRAVSSQGEARTIDDREMKLLRHVHHLQMWLVLYPKLGPMGSLGTRRALMGAFWEERRTRLGELGISPDRIEAIEARLVDGMHEGAWLRTPKSELQLSSKEIEAYQSLHIFQVDPSDGWLSFCHQSYLDYLVALRIVRELPQGNRSLLSWLGPRDEQSLFRREQLRLVLEELRDRNADAYMAQIQTLLEAGETARFHLRLLCLQFLSQVSEPLPAERQFVLELLADPYWHEHVLGDVVRGQTVWFEVLDDVGVFERWLAGDDQKLRDSALEMLLYVVETCGNRVARLLRPYLGREGDWTRRILWVLRFDLAKDSEALFDLRLELTKQGADTAEHVEWSELATKHPTRFLSLVCHLFLALARDLLQGQDRLRAGRRSELDWYHFEKVTATLFPTELRSTAWELLFKAVMSVAQIRRYKVEEHHVLESYAVTFETLEPVINLLRDLGRSLLEEDWAAFAALGESLVQGDRRKEIVFLDSLREGPANPELADWLLGWLMADPWRVQLRMKRDAGKWLLSSLLIDRYASICSEETFRRFEEWLLAYTEPDLLERYQRRHEWMQKSWDLTFPSPFGRTQHALLPELPPDRASDMVPKRIVEMNRKFGTPEASREHEGPMGGLVSSPLGHQVLERMSDRALLKLVASGKLTSSTRADRWKWKGDHLKVASPETIASDFQVATQREPERFGRLLVLWPSDGHPAFLKAVLFGLAFPGDRKPDVETRKPPSHALLEEVLSLPIVQNLARNEEDTQVGENLCDFLQRYTKYPWTDSALDFVVWAARHHPDPSPDHYPVGSVGHDSDHLNHLEINALNVTRGRAGYAIQSLLFEHPEFFAKLWPAIESLVRDPHPAVRVAALGTCLPVINIDKDQAVARFLEAAEGPDQLLATREAGEFLRYSYRTHLSRLLPTLDRMVASTVHGVATAGAKWMAAAYLVAGEIEERFEQCVAGTPEQRKGVAQVAASLIGEGEYAEKAKATLLRLADDTDENVAQEVARSFRQLDLQHLKADREAWNQFARSKAFQADPTPLLQALEEQSGDLLPFADCLLAVGTTFAEELAEAARNHARGVASDASHYLLPLLLRLYEQAKGPDQVVYRRCLDLWDRLLERRVGSAMGLLQEMDRF
ncbi:MAG: toll/interleukin-1 receptor domain-containing protein [bacterium]|nr:toll/interleukin-1 receptor domain-containing protein [bacterium]